MAYGTILVAYDGSEPAGRALNDAFDLVDHGLGMKVLVLSATDPVKTGDPAFNAAARAAGVVLSADENDSAELERLRGELQERVAGHEEAVELRVVYGRAAETIVRTAERERCGLIVMGSRGLGAVRGMLGSVSSAVLREAEVPVLVTK